MTVPTKQCSHIRDKWQCVYQSGHGGGHFIPEDGFDHSDEIRIRVILDREEKLKGQLARAVSQQVDSDRRIRNQRHEIAELRRELERAKSTIRFIYRR